MSNEAKRTNDWQDVPTGGTEYFKPSQMKPGDVFEGTYVGSPVGGKYEKPTHQFLRDDGSKFAINSVGQLDAKLPTIATGTKMRITYNGEKQIDSGKWKGEMAKDFRIQTKGAPQIVAAPATPAKPSDDIDF